MTKSQNILKLLLLIGVVYFFLVSVFHFLGIKVSMLFVYFNVPSYDYQDKIISFLSLGWSAFFFSEFVNVKNGVIKNVKFLLIAGLIAILGLSFINLTTDFKSLSSNIDVFIFWLETVALFFYFVLLLLFYYKSKKFVNK